MTTIEKSILWAIVIIAIILAINITYFMKSMNDAGGVRNIIVETGKEAKAIYKEIEEN